MTNWLQVDGSGVTAGLWTGHVVLAVFASASASQLSCAESGSLSYAVVAS